MQNKPFLRKIHDGNDLNINFDDRKKMWLLQNEPPQISPQKYFQIKYLVFVILFATGDCTLQKQSFGNQ